MNATSATNRNAIVAVLNTLQRWTPDCGTTAVSAVRACRNSSPGGNSEWEPPDPIPNSEVKTLRADGSVPFGHARVGHCQALSRKAPEVERSQGLFSFLMPASLSRGASDWPRRGHRATLACSDRW